jgi:hypothetical protein
VSFLAILPGLFAIVWIARRSPRQAYLDVYLFSLFLLPGWCRFIAPGTPDPTFYEAAILPIAAVSIFPLVRRWKLSFIDLLVFAFAAQIGYSEYANAGYKEAQNLLFDMIAAGVLPYMLAKGFLTTTGDRVRFAKRIVWYLAILTVFFACEFRFGYNPFRLVFDRFFPGQGDGWVTTFRYGLARTAGPFGHAILAGVVFLVGLHLQRWLENSGHWERTFAKFNLPCVTKARVLSVTLFLGIAMTMVRGPQIGAVLAAAVCAIGSGPNPRRRARWVLLAILAIGIPAGIAGYQYASVGREAATTASQESAAYRKELIDKYVDIAKERSLLGWGRNGWPKVAGMPSIDNYYLLLSLMHGVTATALLALLIITLITKLLRNGIETGQLKPAGSSLSFRLAGIYTGFAFAILTVYMGDNVIPIFFTLTGFTDSYLQCGGDRTLLLSASQPATTSPRRFATVFA